jgi:hypothetical protein
VQLLLLVPAGASGWSLNPFTWGDRSAMDQADSNDYMPVVHKEPREQPEITGLSSDYSLPDHPTYDELSQTLQNRIDKLTGKRILLWSVLSKEGGKHGEGKGGKKIKKKRKVRGPKVRRVIGPKGSLSLGHTRSTNQRSMNQRSTYQGHELEEHESEGHELEEHESEPHESEEHESEQHESEGHELEERESEEHQEPEVHPEPEIIYEAEAEVMEHTVSPDDQEPTVVTYEHVTNTTEEVAGGTIVEIGQVTVQHTEQPRVDLITEVDPATRGTVTTPLDTEVATNVTRTSDV